MDRRGGKSHETAFWAGKLVRPEYGLLCPRCGNVLDSADDRDPGALPECRACFEKDAFECPMD